MNQNAEDIEIWISLFVCLSLSWCPDEFVIVLFVFLIERCILNTDLFYMWRYSQYVQFSYLSVLLQFILNIFVLCLIFWFGQTCFRWQCVRCVTSSELITVVLCSLLFESHLRLQNWFKWFFYLQTARVDKFTTKQ